MSDASVGRLLSKDVIVGPAVVVVAEVVDVDVTETMVELAIDAEEDSALVVVRTVDGNPNTEEAVAERNSEVEVTDADEGTEALEMIVEGVEVEIAARVEEMLAEGVIVDCDPIVEKEGSSDEVVVGKNGTVDALEAEDKPDAETEAAPPKAVAAAPPTVTVVVENTTDTMVTVGPWPGVTITAVGRASESVSVAELVVELAWAGAVVDVAVN